MKFQKKPKSSQSQKVQKNQEQDQSQHLDNLQTYNLRLKDIQQAQATIKKLKQISKQNQTKIKKKYKKVNQLFGVMSLFFIKTHDKKKNKQNQKLARLMRIQINRKLVKDKIKKITQGFSQQSHQSCNPEIIQQNSNGNTSEKLQQKQTIICYMCLNKYTEIDNIYHRHCPSCAAFSKQKRFQRSNLSGKIALVTGARIKIGYQITLKLLRDGATVYATTRFIQDALLRYQKQSDYHTFKNRLFFIQCDFLSSEQVNSLIKYMKDNVQHLDILIHNAAQTLTRPVQFYTLQLQNQRKQITADPTKMIYFQNQTYPSLQIQNRMAIDNSGNSQIDLQHVDQFCQPLDLRPKNTWRQKIQDVSLFDCMSTQIINATVPFFITGQLRIIMGGTKPSWVINVSSMQGVFYRANKTCFHPQTNMAKASLNMITRTCASQFSNSQIYMSSVDTGWVTNQNPFQYMVNMVIKHNFTPPLDCIEGAMRVLDPIYQGIRDGKLIYGKFLKNYQQSTW